MPAFQNFNDFGQDDSAKNVAGDTKKIESPPFF
jgi:hypothetical protein